MSNGLSVQEMKIDFQDGGHGGPVKFNLNWQMGVGVVIQSKLLTTDDARRTLTNHNSSS